MSDDHATVPRSLAGRLLLLLEGGTDDGGTVPPSPQVRPAPPRALLHDDLTGPPDRSLFRRRLRAAHAALPPDARLALVSADLDDFKAVNDRYGEAEGDALLGCVGARLAAVLRSGEAAARVGGDEFAAFATVRGPEEAEAFAERVRAALADPVERPSGLLAVTASVGLAVAPDDAATPDGLLARADLALDRAKRRLGGGAVAVYRPAMDAAVRDRREMARLLRDALAGDQFDLHWQVQAAVGAGGPTGYEALLRWRHPDRGAIAPSDFIPVAEETGLILPIGAWVLRRACAVAASWEEPHRIAVNLSPVQIAHPDLPALVRRTLEDTGLPAARLELEITESVVVRDPVRSLAILRRLKEIGVTIAMDDFGTGYSSLATLGVFPFDKIKLDRSFMEEVERNPQVQAIVRAVLALGRSLKVPVLAEGVETREQLIFLAREGCDEVQGYFLGRPMPLDADGRLPAAVLEWSLPGQGRA